MPVTVRQYRPAFVEGFERETHENIASYDELVSIPFIRNFMQNDDGFDRFSISDNNALVAEYKHGDHWVAAMLSGDTEILRLPKFYARERLLPVISRKLPFDEAFPQAKEYIWVRETNSYSGIGGKFRYDDRLWEIVGIGPVWRSHESSMKERENGINWLMQRVLIVPFLENGRLTNSINDYG